MSETNAIRIKTNPDPMEPFFLSQGFKIDNLIFLSGQAAIDQQGNIIGKGDLLFILRIWQISQKYWNCASTGLKNLILPTLLWK